LAPAVTWLAIAAAACADDGLPQPLSVEQALAYAPGHPRTQLELADSFGVDPVRVNLQGAVYQLDVIFERRPQELLRPSETVQILLP
jgi:3-hydroxyacyl-CoA dehydrogenase